MAEPALDNIDGDEGDEQLVTMREKLASVVAELQTEAERREGQRRSIEEGWLDSMRQFYGEYDSKTQKALKDSGSSELFINETRPITRSIEARIADMLFPTDDRNWGITETPVPELASEAEKVAKRAASTQRASDQDPESAEKVDLAIAAKQAELAIRATMDEAKKRARAMQDEIEDHLKACQYEQQCRDVIEDACQLGTGIIKGPVTGDRARPAWQQADDGAYELGQVEDGRPAFWRVDPWSFYPEMSARRNDECESWFERHLYTPRRMRDLAKKPGFDRDVIRSLLREGATSAAPYWIASLRAMTEAYADASESYFHVWEYNGPLVAEQLRTVVEALGREDIGEVALQELEDDPLAEMNVRLWFCQNRVLKLSIHPLESQETLYSVFCLEEDTSSIFGFGAPHMIRNSQKAENAAWRMMMDNAGLSTGPQIVVDEDVVRPADGDWTIRPRKVWLRNSSAPANAQAFETYNIESNQGDLAAIVGMSREHMEIEASLPKIAQGEGGTQTAQTAQGMTILMNSVNVVFRRTVKRWDDDMTTPNIRRIYDWLMAQSPKEHIKGDYEVDARGTSVLLVREMQSQNLMAFLNNYSGHPMLGQYLRDEGVPGLRKLAQTLMLGADELILTDSEIEELQARAQDEPPPPDAAVLSAEAQLEKANIEASSRIRVAEINRETQMMALAQTHNWNLEKLRAELMDARETREQKDRSLAAEAAVAAQTGQHAGGAI